MYYTFESKVLGKFAKKQSKIWHTAYRTESDLFMKFKSASNTEGKEEMKFKYLSVRSLSKGGNKKLN